MPNIFSLTLNTAIDKVIEVNRFKKGIVTLAKDSSLYPSGKGINASRTIESMQEKVTAFGFVGQAEYSTFKELESKFLKIKLTKLDGTTRTNITVIDSNHALIIHARTSGYRTTVKQFNLLLTEIKKTLIEGDIVIISGSLPPGLSNNCYIQAISTCNQKNAKAILDTTGEILKGSILSKPFAVKPNLEELEEFFETKINSEVELVEHAKKINSLGIEMVFVSDGAKGVILTRRNEKGFWKAAVNLHKRKFVGEEIGCGDAFIGGLAIGLKRKVPIPDLLRLSVACGAGNLFTSGPGVCNVKDVEQLIKYVVVEYIDQPGGNHSLKLAKKR